MPTTPTASNANIARKKRVVAKMIVPHNRVMRN